MMKLYHGGPGANSLKPLLTLAEKGVPYEDGFRGLPTREGHDTKKRAAAHS